MSLLLYYIAFLIFSLLINDDEYANALIALIVTIGVQLIVIGCAVQNEDD